MKKLSIFLIICLLFSAIPLDIFGQFDDFWIMDDMLLENSGDNEEITLKTLELYWSTDTYVPFNYQGRKLPTKGSWVFVESHLEISGGNPENLKYSWFLDDIFQESKSGYGKDVFQFVVRRLNNSSHTVLLKVFNESRSFLVERSINIPITNPELILYNKGSSTSAKSFV